MWTVLAYYDLFSGVHLLQRNITINIKHGDTCWRIASSSWVRFGSAGIWSSPLSGKWLTIIMQRSADVPNLHHHLLTYSLDGTMRWWASHSSSQATLLIHLPSSSSHYLKHLKMASSPTQRNFSQSVPSMKILSNIYGIHWIALWDQCSATYRVTFLRITWIMRWMSSKILTCAPGRADLSCCCRRWRISRVLHTIIKSQNLISTLWTVWKIRHT